MARRVVQQATSASRRTIRAKKPTTPWRKFLSTDVPEELRKANPNKHPKWINQRRGTEHNKNDETRVHIARQEGYSDTVFPKGWTDSGGSTTGGYTRKDCRLMWLPNERKEARDYYVQERAESHLPDKERELADKARAAGFRVREERMSKDDDDNATGIVGKLPQD